MIQIKNLTYRYPTGEGKALENISLDIRKGEFVSVIGPNGAGKSTLSYVLSGFIPHFYRGELQGSARFRGQEISEQSLGQLSGQIGLVVQNPFNQITGAKYSVREEIAFGMENLGVPTTEMKRRIVEVLATVGLEEEAERSPFALSGGQQQRLALASILAMQPDLLILDEPTSQLDPHGTRSIFEALASLVDQSNTTVVMIEHKLEWVTQFSDRVFLLDEGRLTAQGSPEEVLSSAALREAGLFSTQYAQVSEAVIEAGLQARPESNPLTLDAARDFLK